jgi:2-dehydropantoate 2-reductase
MVKIMDNKNVKVLLFGTGAVGSFYAGKLSQAGASVSVVSRSDYDVVKKHGIRINSTLGDFHFIPEKVLKSGAEYNDSPDYVIVATKVLPEINVYDIIKDAVTPESTIVLLQNGIEIEKPVAEKFLHNEIISALAFICVSRPDYGNVYHQDYGRIIIGRYPGGGSDKVSLLAGMFAKSGLPIERTDDVITARWKKLLWNAPFNPLSVICGGADTKEMLGNPYIKNLCREVMNEVLQISIADGHPLDESMISKNIEDTEKMTPYKTSMLLDYENKRPMEVEAILGNAVKLAGNYGIQLVYIQTLYALLSIINFKNLKSPE